MNARCSSWGQYQQIQVGQDEVYKYYAQGDFWLEDMKEISALIYIISRDVRNHQAE